MKTDPVVREVRKTRASHAKTPLGQYERLLIERSRWERKATIARNKLQAVNTQIAKMARQILIGGAS